MKRITLLIFTVSYIVISGCEELQEPTTIRLAHVQNTSYPEHEWMEFMAELVDENLKAECR